MHTDSRSTNSNPSSRSKKIGALTFIFAVVLLDIIGLTLLIPVSAYIVRQYTADALSVTMLTVIYAAAQFLATPIIGRLSDRFGRRPVLLICVFGSAVGYFMFGVGGALWILFLSRLIDGITGGNLSTATAYVADVTPPEKRANSFALVGAAFGIGFVVGPAIGGALSQISLSAPAYAAGILSLLNLILGYFTLTESLPPEKRDMRPLQLADANPLGPLGEYLRRPALGMLLMVSMLFNLSFNGRNAILPVFLIDKFTIVPGQLALLLVISGIGNIVVQGFLIGRLVPKFGEKALVVFSLITQAVLSVVLYMLPQYWMLYPVIVLATAASGFFWPTLGAMLSNGVSEREQGKISGVNASLGSLMSILGPLMAGVLYDHVGINSPFWTGAVLLVIAGTLLIRVRPVATVSEAAVQGQQA